MDWFGAASERVMGEEHKIGLQLNGYETVRSPLIGSNECVCCICCTNTRAEYYVMKDGTIWAVSSDGIIGVLRTYNDEFEIKYHSRNYRSWRLGANSTYRNHPVVPPAEDRLSFNGSIGFPFWKDLIGFQTDVDQCVIFNTEGDLLYEGNYDGRRFPLMYNGYDSSSITTDTFHAVSAPIMRPVVNKEHSDRFGPADKIRWLAAEETYPVLERLSSGYAAVGWKTVRDIASGEHIHNTFCGYESKDSYIRHSTYKEYACKKPDPEEEYIPQGDYPDGEPLVFPRNLVKEPSCIDSPDAILNGAAVGDYKCEEYEVIKYRPCFTEFRPETPLRHQIQGFDLNVCGNFIRVIIRNNSVASNKWYRYVGNVETEEDLPERLPANVDFEEWLLGLTNNFQDVPQDDWGVPLWWRDYLETYYVYGSHEKAMYQWMVFDGEDQRRTLEKIKDLKIPNSLEDDRRRDRNAVIEGDGSLTQDEKDKQLEPDFCEVVDGAERILRRDLDGIVPEVDLTAWNPFHPVVDEGRKPSYGIRQFDVISVGSGRDSEKGWYYFTGLSWVEGEGSYQDLKNYSREDLNYIFYKAKDGGFNQCDAGDHIIPASAGRIRCCGDFLLIGLNSDYETRLIFEKDKKILDVSLNGTPQLLEYMKESFACCDSFFGFTVLDTVGSSGTVRSYFYDVKVDEEGEVIRSTRVWSGEYSIDEAPHFGSCTSNCRYYFVKQTDKKGIYFYRSVKRKGSKVVEYGPWHKLLDLNIQNDYNFAPSSGCQSVGDMCRIPCWEPEITVSGYKTYSNGSVMTDLGCETDEGKLICWPLTPYEYCERWSYDTAGCSPVRSWRLALQSLSLVPSWDESKLLTATRMYGNNPGSCPGNCTNIVLDSNGEKIVGIEYEFSQCANSNLLQLVRKSDGVIVDAVDISAEEDWEGLGSSPSDLDIEFPHSGLFVLPHRTRIYITGGSTTTTTDTLIAGVIGLDSDAYCTYISRSFYTQGTGFSHGSTERYFKRLSGKIYYADPYAERIVPIDLGLKGTIAHDRYDNDGGGPRYSCPGYPVDNYPTVCIDGAPYRTFIGRDGQAVLFRQPELDHIEGRLKTFPVLEYANPSGCIVQSIGGVTVTVIRPDALYCCKGVIGTNGQLIACDCEANDDLCVPDLRCSSGGVEVMVKFRDGSAIVTVIRGNAMFRYYRAVTLTSGDQRVLRCCGVYTLLFINGRGTLYYKDKFVAAVSDDWSFNPSCCGEAAIINNKYTGLQRAFVEGMELNASDIFQNDPLTGGSVANNYKVYPLSVKCADDYYLFYCHTGNKIEWADRYRPDTRTYIPKSYLPEDEEPLSEEDEGLLFEGNSPSGEYEPVSKPPVTTYEPTPGIETEEDAINRWMDENTAELILLDGTVCRPKSARLMKVDDQTAKVGPGTWETTDIYRPATAPNKWGRSYPEITEYTFDDPLAPWWDEGQQETKEDGDGTLTLFKSLMDVEDLAFDRGVDGMTLEQRIKNTEKQISNLYSQLEDLERRKHMAYQTWMAYPDTVYDAPFKQRYWAEYKGYEAQIDTISGIRIPLLKAKLRGLWNQAMNGGPDVPEESKQVDGTNTWLFGFRVVPGRNIAAAYYRASFLYNDSRLRSVKSFCSGQFGVFYFTSANFHWIDTPFVERSSHYTEQTDIGFNGMPVYKIIDTHFSLYQMFPNPLSLHDLDHEIPGGVLDMETLGVWLQKYTPYGAYVFHQTQLLSQTLDTEWSDEIEPPYEIPTMEVSEKTHPPYNKEWRDTRFPYGDYLFFNDRNAPVRYDRALSWAKPFEDNCTHSNFNFDSSLDYLRSPFTGEGDRLVVGANGVLHVFDSVMGRMDFNAETLEKIG